MPRLVALDLVGGPSFVTALRKAWDDGEVEGDEAGHTREAMRGVAASPGESYGQSVIGSMGVSSPSRSSICSAIARQRSSV